MSKPETDRRRQPGSSTPRRGRQFDATTIVKEAIDIQARLGTLCAVELLRHNGVPPDVIARVLRDGDYRENDKP